MMNAKTSCEKPFRWQRETTIFPDLRIVSINYEGARQYGKLPFRTTFKYCRRQRDRRARLMNVMKQLDLVNCQLDTARFGRQQKNREQRCCRSTGRHRSIQRIRQIRALFYKHAFHVNQTKGAWRRANTRIAVALVMTRRHRWRWGNYKELAHGRRNDIAQHQRRSNIGVVCQLTVETVWNGISQSGSSPPMCMWFNNSCKRDVWTSCNGWR